MKKILSLLLIASILVMMASCDVVTDLMGQGTATDEPAVNQPEKPKHTHAYSGATCTESSVCRCGDVTSGPLGHDMTDPTCTEAAYCQREGCDYREDVLLTHSLSHAYTEGVSSFSCVMCGETLTLSNSWYLDGTHYDGMVGVANNGKYTTVDGTHKPVITEDGAYQLLNITGEDEQFQLWVPSNKSVLDGFTSDNNAVGFLSFRINAQVGDNFGIKFVDTNSTASRWSAGWCITEPFFYISNLYIKNGKAMVTAYGWDSTALKEIEADIETEFSGWIDVVMGIELDSETDTIIVHYYINGEHCISLSKPLTTLTNGINSVYIDGHTTKEGMGIYLDDIVFGYTSDGEWNFDN